MNSKLNTSNRLLMLNTSNPSISRTRRTYSADVPDGDWATGKRYKHRAKKITPTGIEPPSKRLAIRFSLKGYLEPKWLR